MSLVPTGCEQRVSTTDGESAERLVDRQRTTSRRPLHRGGKHGLIRCIGSAGSGFRVTRRRQSSDSAEKLEFDSGRFWAARGDQEIADRPAFSGSNTEQ